VSSVNSLLCTGGSEGAGHVGYWQGTVPPSLSEHPFGRHEIERIFSLQFSGKEQMTEEKLS
jgi:hypothetical protein